MGLIRQEQILPQDQDSKIRAAIIPEGHDQEPERAQPDM